VYLALKYIYGPGSRGLLRPRADFLSVSLLVLGIASFTFHASLRQTFQFADEIAMLGLAWAILQGVFTIRRSTAYDRLINVSLAVIFPLFAIFYVYTGKIIYHATAFFAMMALIVARGYYLFWLRVPRFPADKCHGWRIRGRKALISLLVAYGLWHLDLEACAQLRGLRERIGLPWAWVLEFHGWWHVLTAISAHMAMAMVREVQDELKRDVQEGLKRDVKKE
jgi:dihydroceramidase